MIDTNHLKDSTPSKRPFVLTAFCIWYLFSFTWQLVEHLIPSGYSAAIAKLPSWFVLSQMIVIYPLSIVSMVGIWQMRRWGLYLYCVVMLFSTALIYYGLHLLPNLNALLLSLVFYIVGFIYLKRMR
jgi:hypothetical protein